MSMLKIERIGGLAGFGLPGSRLRSIGEQAVAALSAADQALVDDMFRNPERHKGSGQARDAFRYRITRNRDGKDETVEVAEAAVPHALRAVVSDKLV
jgi:hypothetical protein